MTTTNRHKLGLKKENNIEYYEIIDGHNSLMDEWNRLNKKIHEMKQPILFLFRHKKRLQELGRDILELQEKFLEWDKKAGNFIIKPHLIFSENDEREIGFVHFTAVLRDIRSKFDNQMIMIATNFNELQHGHSNQVNFIIAVASFALTYVGLILALLTIKYN